MNSRRDFLKVALSLTAVPAVLVLSKASFAQEKKKKKGDAGSTEIGWAVPGKGAAATIKYVEDKSKVAAADRVEKSGVPFNKQDCANCILFQGGLCTIITDNNKKVKPTGWCPTWTHNPAVKS
jgi:hypothetical protein